jgi:membrane fusion protein (multidrug efflux system)
MPHLTTFDHESALRIKALRYNVPYFVWVGALIMILMITACHPQSDRTQKKDDTRGKKNGQIVERAPTPVEVSSVYIGSISSQIRAVSILEPKDRASVRSLISGVVIELKVDEGDLIKRDQSIARISRPGASSLLRQAGSSYRKAKRDFERIKGLVKKGLAPQEELNQAKFQRDQSGLELSRLRAEAKNEQITSPISGVIVSRSLYRGETVSPGQLIVEVMDLSEVYAPLHLPDRWSQVVRVGMPARLFDRTDQLLLDQAYVSRVSPIINAETGTFKVWVSPPAPNQETSTLSKSIKRKPRAKRVKNRHSSRDASTQPPSEQRAILKPGLFVTVEMTIDRHDQTLLLPRESVMYRDGVSSVMLVRDDHVELTQVDVGFKEGQKVEILRPLKANDLVVSFGQRGLKDGAKVTVIQSPAKPLNSSGSSSLTRESDALKR